MERLERITVTTALHNGRPALVLEFSHRLEMWNSEETVPPCTLLVDSDGALNLSAVTKAYIRNWEFWEQGMAFTLLAGMHKVLSAEVALHVVTGRQLAITSPSDKLTRRSTIQELLIALRTSVAMGWWPAPTFRGSSLRHQRASQAAPRGTSMIPAIVFMHQGEVRMTQ